MRVAFADPPYLGQAAKHYANEPTYAGEVDHAALIARLVAEFPDGWALSCSSPSLRALLPLCPDDVRIGAWVKPFHVYKLHVRPAYAWEPVIYRGGRNRGHRAPQKGAVATTPKDWIAANVTLKRGLVGVKPAAFCYWLFVLLNLGPDDEFVDLYPGSGAVTAAWERYRAGLFMPKSGRCAEQRALIAALELALEAHHSVTGTSSPAEPTS